MWGPFFAILILPDPSCKFTKFVAHRHSKKIAFGPLAFNTGGGLNDPALSGDLYKLRLELLGDLLLRTLARLKATAGRPKVETGWYCTMSAVMSCTALRGQQRKNSALRTLIPPATLVVLVLEPAMTLSTTLDSLTPPCRTPGTCWGCGSPPEIKQFEVSLWHLL